MVKFDFILLTKSILAKKLSSSKAHWVTEIVVYCVGIFKTHLVHKEQNTKALNKYRNVFRSWKSPFITLKVKQN